MLVSVVLAVEVLDTVDVEVEATSIVVEKLDVVDTSAGMAVKVLVTVVFELVVLVPTWYNSVSDFCSTVMCIKYNREDDMRPGRWQGHCARARNTRG